MTKRISLDQNFTRNDNSWLISRSLDSNLLNFHFKSEIYQSKIGQGCYFISVQSDDNHLSISIKVSQDIDTFEASTQPHFLYYLFSHKPYSVKKSNTQNTLDFNLIELDSANDVIDDLITKINAVNAQINPDSPIILPISDIKNELSSIKTSLELDKDSFFEIANY